MPKLTIEQKRDKTLRDQLILSQNRCLSDWNFGKISTWEGVFKAQGFGEDYIRQHFSDKVGSLTFKELKDYLQKQKDKLENEIKGFYAQKEELQTSVQIARTGNSNEEGKQVSQHLHISVRAPVAGEESSKEANQEILQVLPTNQEVVQIIKQETKKKEKLPRLDEDYGLHKSPNEHCSLFWFQKKAIKEGWDKLMMI